MKYSMTMIILLCAFQLNAQHEMKMPGPKTENKKPDYWDEATLAELAVIDDRYVDAKKFMTNAQKNYRRKNIPSAIYCAA